MTPSLDTPSGAGLGASHTYTTSYDGSRGEGTNDGSDTGNDGRDNADRQQSENPLSPFTGEDDFTHATQNEDIGKSYRSRRRRMTQHNEDSFSTSFEFMSIGT